VPEGVFVTHVPLVTRHHYDVVTEGAMSSIDDVEGAPTKVLPLFPVYHWYVLPAPVIVAR
jgi:hypothetical protein